MTNELLWLDFETRSRCDLLTRGAYNYAQDPSTEVLCLSWAFNDEDVVTWRPGQPFPDRVAAHIAAGGQVRAHNAQFERLIFWYVLCPDEGVPEPRLEQFYCTSAQMQANGLPGSLEDAARAANSDMRKDHRGAQLIRLLSIPQEDGTFREDEALMQEMVEYCEQDVRTMRAISLWARQLTDQELADYHTSERINDRGILLDRDLALKAIAYAEAETTEIQALVVELTGGAITSVRSPKMRKWVQDRVGPEGVRLMTTYKDGVKKYSIDKAVRANLLLLADEVPDEVPPVVADVIQCADDLWASSVAKFTKAAGLADVEDHRVRGAFKFGGAAATGRFCVDAATEVWTPGGLRRIDSVEVGETVLTASGQLCKVSAKTVKGTEMMYKVQTTAGGWVVCTAGHRILTARGWQHVGALEGFSRPGDLRNCDQIVHDNRVHFRRSGSGLGWGDGSDGPCDIEGEHPSRHSAQEKGGQLLSLENRPQEPDVRCPEASVGHIPERVQVSVGRRPICAGTSHPGAERPGVAVLAGGVGGPPHQRRQDGQPGRQFGCGDACRPPGTTWTEIAAVVPVGERTVWDVSVEGCHSYSAQGLIHHNSSLGLQVHNYPRKCAKDPEAVRAAMMSGAPLVPTFGPRVTDVLKSMLRPSLMAPPGRVLLPIDWSGIEARGLPWLADSPRAEEILDVFRAGGDIYIKAANSIFNLTAPVIQPTEELTGLTKDQRQIGKVATLALGFGGGPNAFAAMGRNYGVLVAPEKAEEIVRAWRRGNGWAVTFWRQLEDAVTYALRHPGQEFAAGRVAYLYDTRHLWCMLPSGRILCYPFVRREDDEVTYLKAAWKPAADAKEWPRARLFKTILSENITQAACADILRWTLREFEAEGLEVVLHVHDEPVVECDEEEAEEVQALMEEIMTEGPPWATGLPLAVEGGPTRRYAK